MIRGKNPGGVCVENFMASILTFPHSLGNYRAGYLTKAHSDGCLHAMKVQRVSEEFVASPVSKWQLKGGISLV